MSDTPRGDEMPEMPRNATMVETLQAKALKARLRAARKYMDHTDQCELSYGGTHKESFAECVCTCGLDAFLARLDKEGL